ncbi:hypothetical protein ABZ863_12325 [Saccharomonospora sp. NPDC046836]|uniref:hypothetical protein n=1 Tax=Saccharomonospora sp. NPDC046836 TaxID=3156921 RepID=UPI0033E3B009
MDTANPVIRLCSEGMRAEAQGRADAARALFEQAWDTATDDYEACVAAHYVARHQTTPRDTLHWNQVCLERADRVGDDRVAGFYASLHVNLGQAHRDLGDDIQAAQHFRLAATHLGAVPAGPYRNWLRLGIAEGQRQTDTAEVTEGEQRLTALLRQLCTQQDLVSLCLLLPACYADLGSAEDRDARAQALLMLHAQRRLGSREQQELSEIIGLLQATDTAA